jgi:hypothetical protein
LGFSLCLEAQGVCCLRLPGDLIDRITAINHPQDEVIDLT